jgi:hypothetical protein
LRTLFWFLWEKLARDDIFELLSEDFRRDFFDRAWAKVGELKWTILGADEPVHLQAEMFQGFTDFPVLTFGEANVQPIVSAGLAL